jgi:hypothetical protein
VAAIGAKARLLCKDGRARRDGYKERWEVFLKTASIIYVKQNKVAP